ncbi:MAG: histidinol dehydrogenase [Betaproteobacteria bacterium]|jgi:histidinol dehydrogenase|nr:histidinol dehydrogenase [Betaproteobacteria bacterium]
MRHLSTVQPDFDARFDELLLFEAAQDPAIDQVVADIVADVKVRGDVALVEYTRRFDDLEVLDASELEIGRDACERALATLPQARRAALVTAAERVRTYHERQRAESWTFHDAQGNELGQRVTALDRVGVYVPGGKAAYPSSVIMNVMPAKVAGVREIVMAVPTPRGERNPLVLAAAALCGVDWVYSIGGAQAIAAMAYGTETLPAVDKIVGPGNAYVAAAKRRVFGVVGIDMIAGPSEILVVSDGKSNPDWVAMDLFSQAEHDELAQAILVSPDRTFIDAVEQSIRRQLPGMSRRDIIKNSLEGRGAFIEVRDLDEACEIVNRVAPEHLELSVEDGEPLLAKIRHAGAIFIGRYASEALGDYCAGPNHVLPTSRTARFSSPLGVYDFQKRSSIIRISREGAAKLGPVAAELAYGEGLTAHARSAEFRMKS